MFQGVRTAPIGLREGRRWLVGLAVCVSVLAFAGPVAAQAPPSAIDQYVEDPPNAGGMTPNGNRPGGGTRNLPPGVVAQIQKLGGSDAALLTQIATSPAYGAPTSALNGQKGAAAAGRPFGEVAGADPRADVSAGDSLAAAASAVQGGDAARLVVLLFVLAAITLGALATAALRQRRRVL